MLCVCVVGGGACLYHVTGPLWQATTAQIEHVICVCVYVCAHVWHVWLAIFHGILAFPSWKTFFYTSRRPWLCCYMKAVIQNENYFPLGSLYYHIMVRPHGFHWPLWGKRLCSNPTEFPRENCWSRRMGGKMKATSAAVHELSWALRVGVSSPWATTQIPGAHDLTWAPSLSICRQAEPSEIAWPVSWERNFLRPCAPSGRPFPTLMAPGGLSNAMIIHKVPPLFLP